MKEGSDGLPSDEQKDAQWSKMGGGVVTLPRRPLEPSFMRFLAGNLWRRALTVFTQMNKKTRNGQKRRVNILTLFNTVGDKNLSVGKYDIKIYVGTKDKFPPPRQMWHKILCRNKRQICLGKYDNIIPFLFKHRLSYIITLSFNFYTISVHKDFKIISWLIIVSYMIYV